MTFDWPSDDIVIETTSDIVFRQALQARDLYPRNDTSGCAVCESGVTLKCDDSCYTTAGYECVQVVSVSNCRECPGTKCRATTTTSSSSSSSSTAAASGGGGGSSPNAGVIAGATIGGIILISMTAFLVWYFFIKKKRVTENLSSYDAVGGPITEKSIPSEDSASRAKRSSTHTVHSIASTVLTRASNIIQIAYIPGVTNRTGNTSPAVLVPPVPPIPIQISDANGNPTAGDQHFFTPNDLRASTYSDMSAFSDRTSYAHQSYAMRSSVASTIYGKNAVIVQAPQTGMRAKPAMVSVRSNGSGVVPPMPTLDTLDKFTPRPKSRAESTFSVGSAFVDQAAATAISVKPAIRVIGGKKASSPLAGSDASSVSTGPTVVSISPTDTDAAKPEVSPFLDPVEESAPPKSGNPARMSAVAEEESPVVTKSTAKEPSPFSDAHATKD